MEIDIGELSFKDISGIAVFCWTVIWQEGEREDMQQMAEIWTQNNHDKDHNQ